MLTPWELVNRANHGEVVAGFVPRADRADALSLQGREEACFSSPGGGSELDELALPYMVTTVSSATIKKCRRSAAGFGPKKTRYVCGYEREEKYR